MEGQNAPTRRVHDFWTGHGCCVQVRGWLLRAHKPAGRYILQGYILQNLLLPRACAQLSLVGCTCSLQSPLMFAPPPIHCRWFSGNVQGGLLTASSCGYTVGDSAVAVLKSSSPDGNANTLSCVTGNGEGE